MIKVEKLTVTFADTLALKNVSIAFESGKTHAVLGSSGSGKSTLLRSILGMTKFSAGVIQLDGQSLKDLSPRLRAERMGYVPQDAGLFPHLNVLQNITIVARAHQWSQEKILNRIDELHQIVPIDPGLYKRLPHQLSGGQRQRVALSRALFLNPKIILLDEPFGALDPIVRAEIQDEVKDLFSRLRKTVLFVTHDVSEADYLGDQVILMDNGQVIQSGPFTELLSSPATPFVKKFIQAQERNLR